MQFYEVTFFCKEKEKLEGEIRRDSESPWPITLNIFSTKTSRIPRITLHFKNVETLKNFSESLNHELSKYC